MKKITFHIKTHLKNTYEPKNQPNSPQDGIYSKTPPSNIEKIKNFAHKHILVSRICLLTAMTILFFSIGSGSAYVYGKYINPTYNQQTDASTSKNTSTTTTNDIASTTNTTDTTTKSSAPSTKPTTTHVSKGKKPTNTPTDPSPDTDTAPSNMAPPSGYTSSQLIFDDQFSGSSLDTSHWNTYMTSRAANGWPWRNNVGGAGTSALGSANNIEYYSPSQVAVNSGVNLTMVPDTSVSGYSYKSGLISSYGKFEFTSGYVQIRVKMPDMSHGTWPALWFMPGPSGTHGDQGEIDLFEGGYLASDAGLPSTTPLNQVLTSHYHEVGTGTSVNIGYNTGADMTAGYHTYGMEYKPGISVKTYFDGNLVANFTNNINTDPYYIIINNSQAASTTSGWHNTGTPPNPSVMSISEVQVYQ